MCYYYMSIVRYLRSHTIVTVLFVLDRLRDTSAWSSLLISVFIFDILWTPSACSQIRRRCGTPAGIPLVTGLSLPFDLSRSSYISFFNQTYILLSIPSGIQHGFKADFLITLSDPYKLIGFLLSTSNVGHHIIKTYINAWQKCYIVIWSS